MTKKKQKVCLNCGNPVELGQDFCNVDCETKWGNSLRGHKKHGIRNM